MQGLLSKIDFWSQARKRSERSQPDLSPVPLLPKLSVRFYTDYPTCNLACSYCVAGHGTTHQKPAQNNWDAERYRVIMQNIARLPYAINIRIGVGGEFFVSKDLVEGAREFSHSQNCDSLNLITNLTLSPKQYDKVFAAFDHAKIALVASFHPEQIKDHRRWFETAAEMARLYDFAVIMVGNPVDLHNLPGYRDSLVARGIEVFIQPFFGMLNGKLYPQAYTDEERDLLRSIIYSRHDYEYLVNAKRPGACYAGAKSIFVNPFGQVFPCGMGFYKENIGDLTKGSEIRINKNPIPCPFRTCQCDTENVNTVEFHTHYEKSGKNQHKYKYRFAELSERDDRFAEWNINY